MTLLLYQHLTQIAEMDQQAGAAGATQHIQLAAVSNQQVATVPPGEQIVAGTCAAAQQSTLQSKLQLAAELFAAR